MEKVTFLDVLTSPFVAFVVAPIVFTVILFVFQKDSKPNKKK